MTVDTLGAAVEIRNWLEENVTSEAVADDYRLIENGVLTSMQTVELVMFLEERFGVTVEDDEISEETFASVRSIVELVESKVS